MPGWTVPRGRPLSFRRVAAQFNLVAIGLVGACLGLLYTQLNPLFHKSEAPAVAPAAAANNLDNELE